MSARLRHRTLRNRRFYLVPRPVARGVGHPCWRESTHRFRFLYTAIEAIPQELRRP